MNVSLNSSKIKDKKKFFIAIYIHYVNCHIVIDLTPDGNEGS